MGYQITEPLGDPAGTTRGQIDRKHAKSAKNPPQKRKKNEHPQQRKKRALFFIRTKIGNSNKSTQQQKPHKKRFCFNNKDKQVRITLVYVELHTLVNLRLSTKPPPSSGFPSASTPTSAPVHRTSTRFASSLTEASKHCFSPPRVTLCNKIQEKTLACI